MLCFSVYFSLGTYKRIYLLPLPRNYITISKVWKEKYKCRLKASLTNRTFIKKLSIILVIIIIFMRMSDTLLKFALDTEKKNVVIHKFN